MRTRPHVACGHLPRSAISQWQAVASRLSSLDSKATCPPPDKPIAGMHVCIAAGRLTSRQRGRQRWRQGQKGRQRCPRMHAARFNHKRVCCVHEDRPNFFLSVCFWERQGASRTQAARSSPPASCRRRRPRREAGATATPPPPGGRRGPGTTSDTRLRPYCRHPALFSVNGYTS